MGPLPLFTFFTLLCISSQGTAYSGAEFSTKAGINYGQLGDNLRSPSESVKLIQSLKAKRVKIYDANSQILNALKNTHLQVSIMIPNEIITNITSNHSLADSWIKSNIAPFCPETKIRYLLVGNEVISSTPNQTWFNLVPAMKKIKIALKNQGLQKIKVGTSMAMDVLETSFPPSNGTFRADIAIPVIKPMLQFLYWTKSFYFLDVYTYFPWSSDPQNINLDYALIQTRNFTYTDPVSNLTYTNLFDQMVDAVVFAMKKLGYPDVRIWIAETGWPNGGDVDQIGCNIHNAATYNRNIVKRLSAKPPIGTPARPGSILPSFIFALYNENMKPGPGTERHFGLLYPNGKKIYPIDLSGETPVWRVCIAGTRPAMSDLSAVAKTSLPTKIRIMLVAGVSKGL